MDVQCTCTKLCKTNKKFKSRNVNRLYISKCRYSKLCKNVMTKS